MTIWSDDDIREVASELTEMLADQGSLSSRYFSGLDEDQMEVVYGFWSSTSNLEDLPIGNAYDKIEKLFRKYVENG